MAIKIRSLVFILLASSVTAFGQQVTDKLCDQVFNNADRILRPKKTYRRDASLPYCSYEYDGKNGASLYITLEQFGSADKAKKELMSDVDIFAYDDHAISPGIKPGKVVDRRSVIWNSHIAIEPARSSDSWVYLIQKNNYVINILSEQPELIEKLEISLRDEKFDDF